MTLNPQTTAFDNAILDISKVLFGKTPRLNKCFSEVNYCVVLSFDDGTADRVFKLANRNRGDIEIEQYLYPAMRRHGLPVPEIEFTHQDYARPSSPFLVMPKFSDYTLAKYCHTNQPAALRACEASGQFIQDLHRRFAEAFKSFLAIEELHALLVRNQEHLDQEEEEEPDLSLIREKDPDLAQLIEQHFSTLSKPTTKRLTHGQPHNLNILADQHGDICVIDFGGIGMSSPLKDLFILLTSHNGWLDSMGDPSERAAILKGYGRLDGTDVQALHFWELSYWVINLLAYLRLAQGPDNSPYIRKKIPQIIDMVRKIAEGKGFIHAL